MSEEKGSSGRLLLLVVVMVRSGVNEKKASQKSFAWSGPPLGRGWREVLLGSPLDWTGRAFRSQQARGRTMAGSRAVVEWGIEEMMTRRANRIHHRRREEEEEGTVMVQRVGLMLVVPMPRDYWSSRVLFEVKGTRRPREPGSLRPKMFYHGLD